MTRVEKDIGLAEGVVKRLKQVFKIEPQIKELTDDERARVTNTYVSNKRVYTFKDKFGNETHFWGSKSEIEKMLLLQKINHAINTGSALDVNIVNEDGNVTGKAKLQIQHGKMNVMISDQNSQPRPPTESDSDNFT